MSNNYAPAGPEKVTIGAGTCIKIGFFGALGALLFSLIVSVVFGVIALVGGFALLPVIQRMLQGG